MPVQELATQHYLEQAQTQRATTEQALALFGAVKLAPEFFAAFRERLAQLLRLVTLAQLNTAGRANRYVGAVLAEQGAPERGQWADPVMLSGVSSNGQPLQERLMAPAAVASRGLQLGMPREDVLQKAESVLTEVVSTEVADAGRVADGVATVAQGAGGYVRMLEPPSCSRCVILAGKFYRYNDGFQRHPRCDCLHIPRAEATDDDLRIDPKAYFESLGEAEQNKVFTKAGAQAIRDGADMSQVVNARKGMRTASIGGRDVLTTIEGTTKRGWYSYVQRAIDPDTQFVRTSRSKYRRTQKPRLMPEQIYSLADEYGWGREEVRRQLTRNGYLTDVPGDGAHALARISNFLST